MVIEADRTGLEVRTVGTADFEAIYPLLELFGNKRMDRSDWQTMLFNYSWWDGPDRGFALYDRGVPVGFLGTILSRRRIAGQESVLCNASSWIVREAYRSASLLLLKPLLAQRDRTILNLTPTQRSYAVFQKCGFRPLEAEQLLLMPTGSPTSAVRGTFTFRAPELESELEADERTLFLKLSRNPRVRHVRVRTKDGCCYIIATPLRVKRLPFAELHYVGDREVFWQNRALLHFAFLRTMGAVGLAVDRRFAGDRAVGFAFRRPAMRLYRPGVPELPPDAIDTLFSELMTVKI